MLLAQFDKNIRVWQMDVVTERDLGLKYNFSAKNMTHFALKYQQLTLNSFSALNLQPRPCLSS